MNSNKEVICTNCNGSGEGQHDGTTCHYCKGRGTQLIQLDQDGEDASDSYLEEHEDDTES